MQHPSHLSGDVGPARVSDASGANALVTSLRESYDADNVHPAEGDKIEIEQESNEQVTWQEIREKLETAHQKVLDEYKPIENAYRCYNNGLKKNIDESSNDLDFEAKYFTGHGGTRKDILAEFDRLSQYLKTNRQGEGWSEENFSVGLRKLKNVIESNKLIIKKYAESKNLTPNATNEINKIREKIEKIRIDAQKIERNYKAIIREFMDQQDEIDKTLPFTLSDIAKKILDTADNHAQRDLRKLHGSIDEINDLTRGLERAWQIQWLDALLPEYLHPVPEDGDSYATLRELRETPLARYLAPQSIRNALQEHGTTGSLHDEIYEWLVSPFERVIDVLDLSFGPNNLNPVGVYRLNQEKLGAVKIFQRKCDDLHQIFSQDEHTLQSLEERLKADKASLRLAELTLEVAELKREHQAVLSRRPDAKQSQSDSSSLDEPLDLSQDSADEQSQSDSSSLDEPLDLSQDSADEQASSLQDSADEHTSNSSDSLDEIVDSWEDLLDEIAEAVKALQNDIAGRLKIEPQIIEDQRAALLNDEVFPLRGRPEDGAEPVDIQLEDLFQEAEEEEDGAEPVDIQLEDLFQEAEEEEEEVSQGLSQAQIEAQTEARIKAKFMESLPSEEEEDLWQREKLKIQGALRVTELQLDDEARRVGRVDKEPLTEAEARQFQERLSTIHAMRTVRDARQQVLARLDTWLEASKDTQPDFLRARRKAGRDMAQLIRERRKDLQELLEGQSTEKLNAAQESLEKRFEEIQAWVERMDGLTEELTHQAPEQNPNTAPYAREIPPVFAIDARATPLERASAFTTYAKALAGYVTRRAEANQHIMNMRLLQLFWETD